MSKNFRFKQFTIWHDKTAMKVGTDGVLLGAWVNCNNSKNILDIGTGTGLIAIMLAQKTNSKITAIDLDTDAYLQAKENIELCEWKNRISSENISFQEFYQNQKSKFDLIVCNPPFFENSLKPQNKKREIARHTNSLPFENLIEGVSKIISDKGFFSVILPVELEQKFNNLCEQNLLFCVRETIVKPNYDKKAKRILLEFSKTKTEKIANILTIEKERHNYTNEYKKITNSFYL